MMIYVRVYLLMDLTFQSVGTSQPSTIGMRVRFPMFNYLRDTIPVRSGTHRNNQNE